MHFLLPVIITSGIRHFRRSNDLLQTICKKGKNVGIQTPSLVSGIRHRKSVGGGENELGNMRRNLLRNKKGEREREREREGEREKEREREKEKEREKERERERQKERERERDPVITFCSHKSREDTVRPRHLVEPRRKLTVHSIVRK